MPVLLKVDTVLQGSANDHEERLLIAAAQEDPSRFAELYELHFENVYAYVARPNDL